MKFLSVFAINFVNSLCEAASKVKWFEAPQGGDQNTDVFIFNDKTPLTKIDVFIVFLWRF
jgi:hypothetical protein